MARLLICVLVALSLVASGARITSSSTSLSKPREVIIVYQNDKAYLLMAGAVEGVDVSNALEHVRSTWKW